MSARIFTHECTVAPLIREMVGFDNKAEQSFRRFKATGFMSHKAEQITNNWLATEQERKIIQLRQDGNVCRSCKWYDRG